MYHDENVREVPSRRIQCDEIWSFCFFWHGDHRLIQTDPLPTRSVDAVHSPLASGPPMILARQGPLLFEQRLSEVSDLDFAFRRRAGGEELQAG